MQVCGSLEGSTGGQQSLMSPIKTLSLENVEHCGGEPEQAATMATRE